MAAEERHRVEFIDSTGVQWRVYLSTDFPWTAPHGKPSLIFESRERVRRVNAIPPGWSQLGPAELEALSWKR